MLAVPAKASSRSNSKKQHYRNGVREEQYYTGGVRKELHYRNGLRKKQHYTGGERKEQPYRNDLRKETAFYRWCKNVTAL